MSEYLQDRSEIINSLFEFSSGIIRGDKGTELLKKYESILSQVYPEDVLIVVDKLVSTGEDMELLKTGINKVLNILYTTLNEIETPVYAKDHFLELMVRENTEMDQRLKSIKPLNRLFNKVFDPVELKEVYADLKAKLIDLQYFHVHYIRKENILFPLVEKLRDDHKCLSMMWSFHDDIRRILKSLISLLEEEEPDKKALNSLLGDLFFRMYAIRFREEKILFPVIYQHISDDEWNDMLMQSAEIGYAWIKNPEKEILIADSSSNRIGLEDTEVDLGTGKIRAGQLMMLFNHLPVDITFIDKDDRVVFYSDPPHRIFPRSKAVIGRTVQNCHPPESVSIVNELLDAFRAGQKNKESFWINMRGKVILIEYYALRDAEGSYAGTMEVSQDVTTIKSLKGEKRLLDM